MKNNKGFAPIAIVLIIIAVLVIGGIAYYSRKSPNTLPTNNVEENNLPQENQNSVTNTPVVNNQVDNTANNSARTTITAITTTTTACLPTTSPWIKVASPNGGEVYQVGGQITVNWTSCNVSLSSNDIFVALHQNGEWQNVIYLSNSTINDGNETFTIPVILPGSYKIRVGSVSANVKQDFSDNTFTISDTFTLPTKK